MKKPKKESLGSAMIKDGRLKWIHINSNAKPKKESEPTGQISSPKTSVRPHYLRAMERLLKIQREQGEELLWRYKALQVINQRLRSKLTAYESKILETPLDKISSISQSTSTDESGRLTYEAGRWKTSANISGSSADFYKTLRKDKKFMALAERAYNDFNQGYADFIASGVEPGSQPDPSPYK